jgi:hypothetical protein
VGQKEATLKATLSEQFKKLEQHRPYRVWWHDSTVIGSDLGDDDKKGIVFDSIQQLIDIADPSELQDDRNNPVPTRLLSVVNERQSPGNEAILTCTQYPNECLYFRPKHADEKDSHEELVLWLPMSGATSANDAYRGFATDQKHISVVNQDEFIYKKNRSMAWFPANVANPLTAPKLPDFLDHSTNKEVSIQPGRTDCFPQKKYWALRNQWQEKFLDAGANQQVPAENVGTDELGLSQIAYPEPLTSADQIKQIKQIADPPTGRSEPQAINGRYYPLWLAGTADKTSFRFRLVHVGERTPFYLMDDALTWRQLLALVRLRKEQPAGRWRDIPKYPDFLKSPEANQQGQQLPGTRPADESKGGTLDLVGFWESVAANAGDDPDLLELACWLFDQKRTQWAANKSEQATKALTRVRRYIVALKAEEDEVAAAKTVRPNGDLSKVAENYRHRREVINDKDLLPYPTERVSPWADPVVDVSPDTLTQQVLSMANSDATPTTDNGKPMPRLVIPMAGQMATAANVRDPKTPHWTGDWSDKQARPPRRPWSTSVLKALGVDDDNGNGIKNLGGNVSELVAADGGYAVIGGNYRLEFNAVQSISYIPVVDAGYSNPAVGVRFLLALSNAGPDEQPVHTKPGNWLATSADLDGAYNVLWGTGVDRFHPNWKTKRDGLKETLWQIDDLREVLWGPDGAVDAVDEQPAGVVTSAVKGVLMGIKDGKPKEWP